MGISFLALWDEGPMGEYEQTSYLQSYLVYLLDCF